MLTIFTKRFIIQISQGPKYISDDDRHFISSCWQALCRIAVLKNFPPFLWEPFLINSYCKYTKKDRVMGLEISYNNYFSKNFCKPLLKYTGNQTKVFQIIRFSKYRWIEIETNLSFQFVFCCFWFATIRSRYVYRSSLSLYSMFFCSKVLWNQTLLTKLFLTSIYVIICHECRGNFF